MGFTHISWLVYYFIGSFITAVLGLKVLKAITAPFFTVKSRFTSKPRSSSESGQQ